MKYLIVGRTASGKDHFVSMLTKHPEFTKVTSYTTRPKRDNNDTKYHFISATELNNYERITETILNGYHYFTTLQEIYDNNVFIVEPEGLYQLVDLMPDTIFTLIYIEADIELRKKHALERHTDKTLSLKKFDDRNSNEEDRFDNFEKQLDEDNSFPHNIHTIIRISNDFTPQAFNDVIELLTDRYNMARKLMPIIDIVKHDVFIKISDDGNKIRIVNQDGTSYFETIEAMAYDCLNNENPFASVMVQFLKQASETDITQLCNAIITQKGESKNDKTK